MDWMRSVFKTVDFSCIGALIKLVHSSDNYAKKTEFLSATLVLKKSELYIRNNEYDPEQDQVEFLTFPVASDIQMTHYQVSDEGNRIDCIKWVNLSAKSQYDRYFGFEFEDSSYFLQFQTHVSKILKIDEEGYQAPGTRKENERKNVEALKVTTHVPASNISKVQVKPELDLEEESKAKDVLKFKREAISYLSHLYTPDMILFMASADLYLLGPNLQAPVLTDPGIGFLLIRHCEFRVTLDLVRNHSIFMRILVDNQFYCFVDTEGQKFSWVEELPSGERRTWRVNLNENLNSLEALINIARYEAEQKVPVSDLSEDDQVWIKGIQNLELSECKKKVSVNFEEVKKGEDDEEEIFDCALAWMSDKVFVGRKGKVTVFCGEEMRSVGKIDLSKTPVKILVQQRDERLVCLGDDLPNVVYCVDVERGVVVDEFSLKDKAFLQVSSVSKLAPLTDEGMFVGLAYNGIYLMDPRDQRKVVQEYEYQTSPAFSAIATTAGGLIAIGSEDGEIRLYSQIGKRATTTFPGLGGAIKGLDTSKCGSWVLATTSNFLLIIKAEYEGELAYTKPLAKKRKPPKRLTLTPEDIAKYNIGKIDFVPAKFNVAENVDETMIITATGNLIVVWNFLSVKAGKLFDYYIKPLDQPIIKSEFKFGEETAVVTYASTVVMQPSKWISH